ncbi:MAG TPA: DUF4037 domain-containing protein [Symbiobacteriaceae bacterium]|jgi:hypothetical protein|nr:DUF4037 domain-containing protein [Symbiobacteriaceae bacterium]
MVRQALDQLISRISLDPAVRAVGRSGGHRSLPEPDAGDIDLFVYCTEIPHAGERTACLARLGADVDQVCIGALAGGNWGVADSLLLRGIETWVMYFTVEQLWAEIEATLAGRSVARVENYYYPVGRLAMLQRMEVLYDPDGLFAEVADAIREYPAPLLRAQLAFHLPRMHDEEDFGRAVERQDLLFYHFVFDLALDHVLQALFALNQTYFPSRKRSFDYIAGFARKPARCEERLRMAVELGGRPDTLAESYRIWQELTRELAALDEPVQ